MAGTGPPTSPAIGLLQRGAAVNAVNRDGDTQLHLAVSYNNKEAVADLLQRGADVDAVDWTGKTPLHLAATFNLNEIVTELLQGGADINAVDYASKTPLHSAAEHSSEEVVAELLKRGADVNAMSKSDITSLHWAALNTNKEVVAQLLQLGADANAVDELGRTPLHWAFKFTSTKAVVELLLERGADVNAVANGGTTPLHLATSSNNKEVIAELIQRGANVNAVDNDGNTPFYWAAMKDHKEVVAELIQGGADVKVADEVGNNPLHWAASYSSKEAVAKLLQRGANINSVNKAGETPLLLAAMNNNKEAVAELLQCGANPQTVGNAASTPLHWATKCSSKEAVADLLQYGAVVNAVDNDGKTPLHLAVENNGKEVVAELFQREADVNVADSDGNTPLHMTAENNSKEAVAELLQRGAAVNAVNKASDTPLHLAAENNSIEAVAELLQRGAAVNAVNKASDTPLHLAAENNSIEAVAELLQRGADVNAVDRCGNTPLHLATIGNSEKVAAALLNHGANFTLLNLQCRTPLDIAFTKVESKIFSNICEKILKNPFPVNKLGETVFHISAKFCIREVLELAEHPGYCREVFLYNRDTSGNSPIHNWAMASLTNELGNSENQTVITEYGEMLIKMGALVNARNNQDQTPLHVAVSREAIVCLLEHGAWPNATSACSGNTPLLTRVTSLDGSSLEVYERFSKEGSCRLDGRKDEKWQEIVAMCLNPWITNNSGQSVLEVLISKNSFVLAEALISFFKDAAQLNKKHTNGETILHILCKANKSELLQVMDDLLKAGVTVNAMNSAKQTPLHLVCRKISDISESVEDVSYSMCYWIGKRLLAYGADSSLQDSDGASCYDIAESLPQLLELLKQPIDITTIPPLLRWSEPKSEAYRSAIAQVVRRQKSKQIECYHYHKEPIGSGGFGHVFAGVDERDGREVAVKRIEKHKLVRPRDRREIVNLVKLRNCEEVVRYLGHCEDADFVFLILDLMEGTLTEYLDKTSRDASLNVSLCRDVVKGLKYLHEMNVSHRDIKPGNILYRVSPRVCFKIADFGLSSKATFNTTLQTASITYAAAGTRCWMAPELLQATEEINHSEASDVFACGLVLHYFLAEKRHPFYNPSTAAKSAISEQNETERNIMDYKPFLHKDLSPEARHLMEIMLDENCGKRPRTTDILSEPYFWSEAKKIRFLEAVGNQPEVQRPRHKVTAPSPVEQDLENTLGNEFAVVGWENSIPDVYLEMTGAGGRRYDTYSAVDLVRFVRNSYAHASDQNRTTLVQDHLMKDIVFFKKFPSLLIEVFKAVIAHGWDKTRKEIECALKMD